MDKPGGIRWQGGLAVWVGGVLVSLLLPFVPSWPVWVAVGLLCTVAAGYSRAGRYAVLLWLGMLWGVLGTERALAGQWLVQEQARSVHVFIKVADLPQRDDKRVRFVADATDDAGRHYRLLLSDYRLREWPAGSRWQVQAKARAPIGEWNGRGMDREAWALAHGIDGLGSVGEREWVGGAEWTDGILLLRERASMRWQQVLELPYGVALMRALSIGEQDALPSEAWQALRPLGLSHLVSISGLHVTMVSAWVMWLVRGCLRLCPVVFRRPRTIILCAGLLAALVYAALAGFSVPTQRTVWMLAVLAWSWWRRGRLAGWSAWWLALAAVLLVDPLAALSVGSWLSFGLVAALLWGGSWRLGISGWRQAWRAQWSALLMTVVLVGYGFSAVPLLSPLANALAIPWFSWVLTPLALAASLLPFLPLQWLAATLAEGSMQVLMRAGAWAPEWSVAAAPWPLLLAAGCAVMVWLLPRGLGLRPLAAVLLGAFVAYRPAKLPTGAAAVTVWDVGQGLSVEIQTASHVLLFDSGTEAAAQMNVLPNLRAQGLRALDGLVLSHHDNDHDGGAPLLQRQLPVRQLWAGQPSFYPQAGGCGDGIHWQWDGVHFEFLRPDGVFEADNDQSCVLRVVAGKNAVLLTGDLSRAGERALVDKYGAGLFSQLLVLGHHGSRSSSDGTFLNAVSPVWAVASSGFANAYRHPSADTQNRLRAHGIRLLRTDWGGAWVARLPADEDMTISPIGRLQPYWHRKPLPEGALLN